MNLSQMRTLCRNLLNEDTAGFWTDAQLNAYLELANMKVNSIISGARQDYFTQSSTFATVANIASYAFPTDCVYIRRMEIYDAADDSNIDKVDELRFPRMEANGEWPFKSPGQPKRYIIVGTHFDLLPTPDDAYTMRIYYNALPAALAVDADTPTSPADFHDMLVLYACLLAKKQNETADGDFASLFRDRRDELIRVITNRGGDDPVFVEAYLEGII